VRELPSGRQYTILHGADRATVVEVSGGLRSYVADGRELLDGYAEDEIAAGARGQPLIPWPNRLRDGRYTWDDQTHQAPLSEPEKGNAIHGFLRFTNWTCLGQTTSRVDLGHVLHPHPGYPFTLAVRLSYELGPDGLAVTTARNVGTQALPYASGSTPTSRRHPPRSSTSAPCRHPAPRICRPTTAAYPPDGSRCTAATTTSRRATTCTQTGQVLISRLRGSSAGAARGASSFLTETISRVRNAGATGQLTVRADSAFHSKKVLATAAKFDVRFSITARHDKRVRAAIDAIPEQAWQPIPYWLSTPEVSGAGIAETPFTVWASDKRHARQVRLVVRRV
jgi:hypothetical protein